MIKKEDTIIIGKFHKTHALKGELNAVLEVDSDIFADEIPILVEIDGIIVPFYIESFRKKGSTSNLIIIDGVNSEEDARKFVNKEIRILRSEAEKLGIESEDDENFIGYTIVEANTSKEIGVVTEIDNTTENILFIVDKGDDSFLYIPAVEEFISDIDDDCKKLIMNLPEGLMEINTTE